MMYDHDAIEEQAILRPAARMCVAAAAGQADCRIMVSIGKTAMLLPFAEEDVLWLGIPLAISGRNIFFDRNIFHD